MYKIVKTIENGCIMFSDVPNSWECDGWLFWPNLSTRDPNAEKKLHHLKLRQAKPENSWTKMPCEVKAEYKNFQDARNSVKMFSQMADTEDEER